MTTAKSMLMKEVDLGSWEDVEAELPQYAAMDLSQFKVQKGKPLSKKFKVNLLNLLDHRENIC